jgi:hypothetical protein
MSKLQGSLSQSYACSPHGRSCGDGDPVKQQGCCSWWRCKFCRVLRCGRSFTLITLSLSYRLNVPQMFDIVITIVTYRTHSLISHSGYILGISPNMDTCDWTLDTCDRSTIVLPK